VKKHFFALLIAISASLFCGGTSFWLATQPNLSEAHAHLLETTLRLWLISTQKTLDLCSKEDILPSTPRKKKKGKQ